MQLRHDPTFALATALLPRRVRPGVHALYGFFRGADELVDGPHKPPTPAARRAALDAWGRELEDGVRRGRSDHPVLGALVDAGRRHAIPLELAPRYLDSMRVDCEAPVRLRDRAALDDYMEGSAATVGRLVAPLLGVPGERREAVARLGLAFQLTNFLRDAGEDLALDRVYLPGIDAGALAAGRSTPAPLDEVARARELFGAADEVCASVTPRVRPAIRTATAMYRRTLRRVEVRGLSPA
ncbi:squalene/phytoene synthase family protein [Conexibacter sp. SYSU D00693]|uniref:phytoene/squalene synthase family protein n=1 Tax=Conexibacter sp. SYSU D00693 TaxID=2812560 RepID=UPI00196B940B|nr:squalene/phytoene synthase family protein [Conexibacter sp. SYSU D00693]